MQLHMLKNHIKSCSTAAFPELPTTTPLAVVVHNNQRKIDARLITHLWS
jgi:hypothetical protein